jgi:RNA polymerase sigma-70 factor (ECF subfamily)
MAQYVNIDDANLLANLIAGDEQAFTEIYNRYWKKLIALAYSHTKDKYLAEEIVQEVFLSLWNRKKAVDIKSLNAYLATAVKFSIFKYVNSRNRQAKIIDTITKNAAYDLPDDLLQAKFLEEYINQIVELLPEKCRLVYQYSRKRGMSVPEIAAEMSIAGKTVEAHLTKALKVLRLNLKELLMLICILNSL